jgi:class 3 adenylate cyclase
LERELTSLVSQERAILFADVADSTSLYELFGDKVAASVIDACLSLLSVEVTKWQGEVVKKIGDEVMAVFPTADVACAAARGMQFAVDAFPSKDGPKLAIKIGFQFGHVLEREQDFWGDAVNTAARLAGLARRGQILTTASTVDWLLPHHLSAAHRLEALNVKGKQDAVDVFEIVWRDDVEKTHAAPAVPRRNAATNLTLTLAGKALNFPLEKTCLWLGRENTCELMIAEKTASRRHARIDRRDGQYFLVDDSMNGTYICSADADDVLLRREQLLLRGTGKISLGTPASVAEFPLHFSVE